MASLIRGYQYDIFISYRQKDNKYDGWVTEFVDHLKKELEATFKEDVSVYFDINPHDGLLETHEVDDSLRNKLNCLVFIPVISRTYCDPKSFAWEHEFKAFIEQGSHDQFGLKVRLPGGNVVSRILPIRIHELSTTDFKLCESILVGALRGVEFIYKSAGVNRPLRSIEDKPYDNLNKTIYRDQINKVANAVNDIISSLQKGGSEAVKNDVTAQKDEISRQIRIWQKTKTGLPGRNPKRRFAFLFLLIVGLLAVFVTYRTIHLNNTRKTIAFIPLRTPENDTELKWNGDYLLEALNDRLSNVKIINVIPSIATLQFSNTNKSLASIRRELKANYLIDGNIQRDGNNIKIWIELSAARTKKMLWSKTYIWDKDQISRITWEIVGVIADKLDISLSREVKKYIETEPSKYSGAHQDYISANMYLKNAWFYINYGDKLLDSASFASAIETYDKAIREDSLFSLAYANCAIAMSHGFYVNQLDSSYIEKCKKYIDKAISIDKDLPEAQIALGFYYYYCNLDLNKALYYFNKAAEEDPGNYQPLFYMSLVYRKLGEWAKSQSLINRVIMSNPQEALFLTNIGLSYTYLHRYDSAMIFHQKAIDLMPGWSDGYRNKIQTIILNNGNVAEARQLLETLIKKTGDVSIEDKILFDIYEGKYSDALYKAENSNPDDFTVAGDRYLYLAKISNLLKKPDISRIYYDSALAVLNRELIKNPRSFTIHSLTGIAYAGLGKKANAIAEVEKAIKLAEKDKVDESDVKIYYAQILTMVGEYDHAMGLLNYLLNNPSCFSRYLLQLDPVWDPLKGLPDYKTMLKNIQKI